MKALSTAVARWNPTIHALTFTISYSTMPMIITHTLFGFHAWFLIHRPGHAMAQTLYQLQTLRQTKVYYALYWCSPLRWRAHEMQICISLVSTDKHWDWWMLQVLYLLPIQSLDRQHGLILMRAQDLASHHQLLEGVWLHERDMSRVGKPVAHQQSGLSRDLDAVTSWLLIAIYIVQSLRCKMSNSPER